MSAHKVMALVVVLFALAFVPRADAVRYGVDGKKKRRVQTSVAVEFDFAIKTENPAAAVGVLADLNEQLQDPDAAIFKGNTTGALVVGQTAEMELKCPPGAYRTEGASTCETCPVGYEPNDDSTGCDNCQLHDIEDGLAWVSDGTHCYPCAPGHSPDDGRSACIRCPLMTYSERGVECVRCIDSQMPNGGSTGCICAVGYYNATFGHIKCYGAAESFAPLDFPATEDDTGMVLTQDECLTCDESCTNCNYGHATLQPGYGVAMNKFEQKDPLYKVAGHRAVFECPLKKACNVSYDSINLDTGLNGTGWEQCGDGYAGPLCMLCASGYSRKGFSGPCNLCLSGTNLNLFVVFIIGLLAYVGFLAAIYTLIVLDMAQSGVDEDGDGIDDGAQDQSFLKRNIRTFVSMVKILIGVSSPTSPLIHHALSF
jgi:hypothetical protein